MMKKMRVLVIGLLVCFIVPNCVEAATVNLMCDSRTYTITKNEGYSEEITLASGDKYNLNAYDTSFDGVSVPTYCLSPAKRRSNFYHCDRKLDPTGYSTGIGSSKHAFDVATTWAYQRIKELDLDIRSKESRQIGELVFRWLSNNYAILDVQEGFGGGGRFNTYFFLEYGGAPKSMYWSGISDSHFQNTVNTAKDIFLNAAQVGNKVYKGTGGHYTYQNLIDQGYFSDGKNSGIWGDDYDVTVISTTINNGVETANLKIEAKPGHEPSQIYWNELNVSCENATCSVVPGSISGSGSVGYATIRINRKGSNSTVKVYLDMSIYDEKAANANILLLSPDAGNSFQKMLVMNPGDSSNVFRGKTRIPLNLSQCVKKGSEYYMCSRSEDGEETCDSTPITDPKKQQELGCPVPNNYCRVQDGQYIGPNGNPVDEQTFYEKCCDQLDPNTPEYKEYCSCGDPEIDKNFIGACTEFNSEEEVLINYVRDAKEDAKLKTCLFREGGGDLGKNKYQMKDQPEFVNNPYCKVSCIEEYEFALPNAKYSTSGSYFTLSTDIMGKRTCYVNASASNNYNGIDYEKFKEDLNNKRKEVIEAYNEYQKWKAAAAVPYEIETGDARAGGRQDSYTCGIRGNEACGDGCSGGDTTEWKVVKKEWHYIAYDYNGGILHLTERYSSGSETSCNECSCDDDDIGSEASPSHESNRDSALAALKNRVKELKEIIRQYNSCSGVDDSWAGNTSTWENNFNFNPEIQFEYEEPYQDMGGFNDKFVQVSSSPSSSEHYCTGDVGNSYECNGSSSAPSKNESFFSCDENGCKTFTVNVGAAKYITKEKSVEATYQPKNEFSIYTPIGTIVLNEENGLYTVLCKEDNCLPVSLNQTTGVFNYKFKFTKIGQYNDSNELGRLMGGYNSVFDAANVDAGYVCNYINNCPDCPVTCVDPPCGVSICDDCPVYCSNCIFDGKQSTFFYRTTSLNNLNPTERKDTNWNEKNNIKAKLTKDRIEKAGETVYEKPEYSYTVNATQMSNIRAFNKSVNGYLNTVMEDGSDSLHCESVNGYSNIKCFSTFLDTEGKKYFTENARNEEWILWPESGYYTSGTKYVVQDGIGPSWK